MTVDSRVPQRGILVATKREHGLIHLFRVEHFEVYEKMEVFHCQTARNGCRPDISQAERVGAMQGELDWLAEQHHYEAELQRINIS